MSTFRSAYRSAHRLAHPTTPPGWHGTLRCSVAALATCCCSAAAQAQSVEQQALQTQPAAQQPLLKATTRLSPELNTRSNVPTAQLEQSLWAGRGPVNVGVQWQGRVQAYRPDASPVWNTAVYSGSESGNVAMGMAVNVTDRTRIELTRPFESNAVRGNAPVPGQGVKLSLEVRPVNKMAGLRRGLRVELASNSTLTFRPRGGGLSVYYNSSF